MRGAGGAATYPPYVVLSLLLGREQEAIERLAAARETECAQQNELCEQFHLFEAAST